jgi:hypothetical protein
VAISKEFNLTFCCEFGLLTDVFIKELNVVATVSGSLKQSLGMGKLLRDDAATLKQIGTKNKNMFLK